MPGNPITAMTDPASAPSAASRRRPAPKPLPGARWRIERAAHVSPRRILEAGKAVAYGTTDAHAQRLMQTLNLAQILLVTLEIARDVLAGHGDEFPGRSRIVSLLDTAIAYARSVLR